ERPLRARNGEPRLRAADWRDHRERSVRSPQAGRARETSISRETVMNYSLQGKAAIVTGAGGGIGGAIARAFADAGAKVACVDLEVGKVGAPLLPIRCDVSSESETRAAVEQAVKAFGALHVLVNAAAMRDPSA